MVRQQETGGGYEISAEKRGTVTPTLEETVESWVRVFRDSDAAIENYETRRKQDGDEFRLEDSGIGENSYIYEGIIEGFGYQELIFRIRNVSARVTTFSLFGGNLSSVEKWANRLAEKINENQRLGQWPENVSTPELGVGASDTSTIAQTAPPKITATPTLAPKTAPNGPIRGEIQSKAPTLVPTPTPVPPKDLEIFNVNSYTFQREVWGCCGGIVIGEIRNPFEFIVTGVQIDLTFFDSNGRVEYSSSSSSSTEIDYSEVAVLLPGESSVFKVWGFGSDIAGFEIEATYTEHEGDITLENYEMTNFELIRCYQDARYANSRHYCEFNVSVRNNGELNVSSSLRIGFFDERGTLIEVLDSKLDGYEYRAGEYSSSDRWWYLLNTVGRSSKAAGVDARSLNMGGIDPDTRIETFHIREFRSVIDLTDASSMKASFH